MLKTNLATPILFLTLSLVGCGGGGSGTTTETPTPEPEVVDLTEYRPGGETTVVRSSSETFSRAADNLSLTEDNIFALGDAEFERIQSGGALGPLFNANSCQGCHLKDGRGNPPADADTPMTSMFLRVGIGRDEINGVIADPIYGSQLQTFGVDTTESTDGIAVHDGALTSAGAIGEAFAFIEYEEIAGEYSDGQSYSLQRPTYKIKNASYGDFDENVVFSPRVASSMQGLGLLEAIPEDQILQNVDETDQNLDGISGRANYGWSAINDQTELGRFGWKASTPTVLQQSSGAYRGDLGITNSLFDEESCTNMQTACIQEAGNEDEISPSVDTTDFILATVEFYSKTLAVNERDGFDIATETWDEQVLRGKQLFGDAGCTQCHTASFVTGTAAGSHLGDVDGFSLSAPSTVVAELSNQTIWPYTDMLIHDMGGQCDAVVREDELGASCTTGAACYWVVRCEGLADGRDDFLATGTEWRTAPLWNLGLVQEVNAQAGFLHDGRARTIEEAVLWHSGSSDSEQSSEANTAWTAYIDMSADERTDLLAFLESL